MEKKKITEADHLEKEWLEEAKEQTHETLPEFIDHLMNDYEHDYGTCIKAVSAAMLGTFWAFNRQEGFTGFQTSLIPWLLMSEFWGNSEVGRRVIDYDDMLYPQYQNRYEKTITRDQFSKLQKKASERLAAGTPMHPDVKKHMESIVAGTIPFGYKLFEED